ncbi:rhomboid family intramembrane serine protease [Singulisphaera rosea]
MGIYDREYYRGETSGSGWLSGDAPACKVIIAVNVFLFVLTKTGAIGDGLFGELEANSRAIFYQGHVWQLLTATFLHSDDIFHVGWNMLFLWFVGRDMESMYGTVNFAVFYICAAVVSTLGWAIFSLQTGDPRPMIGASGAVMAVIVLYVLYYPHREFLLFFVLPVQAWLLVLMYVGRDFLALLNGQQFTKVALVSHLTGAAFGYLFKRFDLRWSRISWNRVRRPKLRLVMPDSRDKPARSTGPTWSPNAAATPKPSVTAILPEESLDARLDEILAKIARDGRGALTDEENRILQEASRRARNRRSDRI